MAPTTSPGRRTHVVLVPGFAGFDALGQLQYYADVTPLFREWAASAGGAGHPVLHYFDNLPTAGVATRGARLRDWLAKRVARGELQRGDRVALVGHSTGGLDIRKLVWDLARDPDEEIPVDGAQGAAYTVLARDVLGLLERIVFLSVPQWGTNLADWVRAWPVARKALVAKLHGAVAARRLPLGEQVETCLAGSTADCTRSQLFLAVRDAVSEMCTHRGDDARRIAAAQEAWAEVELWLRHISSNFAAIDDLAVTPRGEGATPARFDEKDRQRERDAWSDHGIATRSYATVGNRPLLLGRGVQRSAWQPWNPCTWAKADERAGAAPNTDLLYRLCYRACAGGPFAIPGGGTTARARRLDTGEEQEIEVWDNDGIVNTASMLWPDGPETRLVPGDHGDVLGHYHLVDAVPPAGRRYHTYDLLGSGSAFGGDTFRSVWRDVFEFCAG